MSTNRGTPKQNRIGVYLHEHCPLVDHIRAGNGTPPITAQRSAGILTCYDDEYCSLIADFLEDRLAGKVVVEIGAGIGLLACHVAQFAKRVYAIEVDPGWAGIFATCLWERKPKNLTFIFGCAEEAPPICADVAFFCTYSGRPAMYRAATLFAPMVIDVYAELHAKDPKYREREWAMQNREDVDLDQPMPEAKTE